MSVFLDRVSFTVPATTNLYAPETLDLCRRSTDLGRAAITGVTAGIESSSASGAVAELWLLRLNGDPTNAADFYFSGKIVVSGAETFPLASVPGVQIRVKSGGSAGAVVVNASADE